MTESSKSNLRELPFLDGLSSAFMILCVTIFPNHSRAN